MSMIAGCGIMEIEFDGTVTYSRIGLDPFRNVQRVEEGGDRYESGEASDG